MGISGSTPSSKPTYLPGAKQLGGQLFSPGGPLASLLGGAPDLGYEAGVNRGFEQLNSNLASQGLFGSPLGALSATNYASQAATGREQNRLSTLLQATQPAGTTSLGGGGGISGGLLGL